jgi:hypothetical protein
LPLHQTAPCHQFQQRQYLQRQQQHDQQAHYPFGHPHQQRHAGMAPALKRW